MPLKVFILQEAINYRYVLDMLWFELLEVSSKLRSRLANKRIYDAAVQVSHQGHDHFRIFLYHGRAANQKDFSCDVYGECSLRR
ncbi:hypothetical protein X971_2865 [Agrobacterium tumefaciens LBA4213 (Ach5)]|nr:hypothetical protein X971_2865 [Agrobacterium tumefaciens LBA4213 (Ach5)]